LSTIVSVIILFASSLARFVHPLHQPPRHLQSRRPTNVMRTPLMQLIAPAGQIDSLNP
jgi:hypothetical protein